jgi:hypothetical protein
LQSKSQTSLSFHRGDNLQHSSLQKLHQAQYEQQLWKENPTFSPSRKIQIKFGNLDHRWSKPYFFLHFRPPLIKNAKESRNSKRSVVNHFWFEINFNS